MKSFDERKGKAFFCFSYLLKAILVGFENDFREICRSLSDNKKQIIIESEV